MADQLATSGTSGIGGLLFGNPGYNSADIDQGTKDLISRQAQDAMAPGAKASDWAQDLTRGTSTGADATGNNNFHTALGGPQDSNMAAALQARSQRMTDADLNQLQRQSQVEGVNQQNKHLQSAFQGVSAQQQAQNAANRAQIQAAQNNAKTRSSIISGIFGAAGTAAGFMGGGGGMGGDQAASANLNNASEGNVDLSTGLNTG